MGLTVRAAMPAALLAGSALLLGACGGRDPVDTPVNWWHQLEGGEIALQRPPPPGVDAPYPKVGTTPAKPPPMLSADLRASLTEQLVEQRNLSTRLNADDPIVTPVLPPAAAPAPGATAATAGTKPDASPAPGRPAPAGAAAAPTADAAPAANPAVSSATLDAAEAPPAPPLPAERSSKDGSRDGTQSLPQGGELAMPAIVPDQAGILPASGPTPSIAAAPPSSPGLPGFPVLAQPTYATVVHPNYALADQAGERLLFPDGSDALSPGQDGTLRTLATRRGANGTVFVHGYGSAASDAPADQAQALTLAALRARAVATALREHGVPASAIHIRADAFGRGATAGLVD